MDVSIQEHLAFKLTEPVRFLVFSASLREDSSASPSMTGGSRGLWSLRIPLEHLGSRVFPDMFSLAQAHKAFDPEGNIANEQLRLRFELTVQAFMELAEAAKKYPCAKKAWFEYLGEPTEAATARAQ